MHLHYHHQVLFQATWPTHTVHTKTHHAHKESSIQYTVYSIQPTLYNIALIIAFLVAYQISVQAIHKPRKL